MTPEETLELRLLQRAAPLSRWRWRAEVKKLRRRGQDSPFMVHLCELQLLHTVWRELLREAGRPAETPTAAALRASRRIATYKCREYLRNHPA